MNYSEFEKVVFDHLFDKHKKDKNFTFSVRQKASKGRETDIFIGTQKAGYFATTLWSIPVFFPGSSGDLLDFIFSEKDGRFYIRFQYFMSRNANELQNKANIELGKVYYDKIKSDKFELNKVSEKNKMYIIRFYYPNEGCNSIKEMFDAFDEMIKILTPIIDESISIVKEKYSEWIAHRITNEEFDKMIDNMTRRIGKHGNKNFAEIKEEQISDGEIIYNNNILKENLNIILYGPPGTGKTYFTIDKAVEIITGVKSNDHNKNKAKFDDLREKGQIEFVTFHQNYSYEDFIVGIKPDTNNEQLFFRQNKGMFYEIARRARENYLESKGINVESKIFDIILDEILKPLEEGKEVEIKMKSKISFWIYDSSERSLFYRKRKGGTSHTLSKETIKELLDDAREYPSGLKSYYAPLIEKIKSLKVTQKKQKAIEGLKNFVLIIDEINRANISRVFGELITLLEVDKRMDADNELKITLPNNEKDFCLPPNLYIIGTMNTADKSIALVDIALRRRFHFIGYYPSKQILDELYTKGLISKLVIDLLVTINKNIACKKGNDFVIGHAYFIDKLEESDIIEIIKNKIIPLLNEYFSGKIDTIADIFNESPFIVKYNIDNFNWEINKIK